MKSFIIALALLIAGTANAADTKECDQWCKPFLSSLPTEEYVFFGASTLDMLTTLDIKNHPKIHETNFLLGEHPSDGKILGYFVGMDLLHAAITYELVDQNVPKPIVKAWEYVTIGVETGYAVHNLHLGLRFSF